MASWETSRVSITAIGYQALHSFTTGAAGFKQVGLDTATGTAALFLNTTGPNNTAVGSIKEIQLLVTDGKQRDLTIQRVSGTG